MFMHDTANDELPINSHLRNDSTTYDLFFLSLQRNSHAVAPWIASGAIDQLAIIVMNPY